MALFKYDKAPISRTQGQTYILIDVLDAKYLQELSHEEAVALQEFVCRHGGLQRNVEEIQQRKGVTIRKFITSLLATGGSTKRTEVLNRVDLDGQPTCFEGMQVDYNLTTIQVLECLRLLMPYK